MALHWNRVGRIVGIICILLHIHTSQVYAKRLHEKIYESFFGGTCFRRLNGTHQTGCSSAESGSVGALHYVYDLNQLEFLLNSPPAPPYAAIMESDIFNRQNMLRLKHEGGANITAVIVLNGFKNFSEDTAGFSHELKCPNQYSGILLPNSLQTATCSVEHPEDTWNPWGSGLLHEDFPFPIVFIPNNETVVKLIQCFTKFNSFDYQTQHLRSLCSVEIKSFMSAAVSSEVCWRRSNFVNNLAQTRYCDPLEGKNIYATLFPRKIVEPTLQEDLRELQVDREEKFILVTARMDTTGMFEGVYVNLEEMTRGHQKIQSQVKAQEKQAKMKKQQGHSATAQKKAAQKALGHVCAVCKSQMPDPKTYKQHYESKHPKHELPPELKDV